MSAREYYERNTRLFLALGVGRQARSIHRAVWAEGAADYAEALAYVNRLVLRAAGAARRELGVRGRPLLVIDLGCGVGGTVLFLAERLGPAYFGVGLSISAAQVRLARRDAVRSGLDRHGVFVEGDYLRVPAGAAFDLAVAIESLAHAPDLARAFREAAGALRPGGRLAVCDDFLAPGRPRGAREARWVDAFRVGWRAPGLTSLDEAVELARAAGLRLVEQRDLTPDLRRLRLPTPLVDGVLALGGMLPRRHLFAWSNLGGLALQHCLRRGVIRYQWLVFERERRGAGEARP